MSYNLREDGKIVVSKFMEKEFINDKILVIYGDIDHVYIKAQDVAEWLNYAFKDNRKTHRDTSKMCKNIPDNMKIKILVDESCGGIQIPPTSKKARINQTHNMLTEDGLYRLLMDSKKPEAEKFKEYITNLLKSIRKGDIKGLIDLVNNDTMSLREDTKDGYKKLKKICDQIDDEFLTVYPQDLEKPTKKIICDLMKEPIGCLGVKRSDMNKQQIKAFNIIQKHIFAKLWNMLDILMSNEVAIKQSTLIRKIKKEISEVIDEYDLEILSYTTKKRTTDDKYNRDSEGHIIIERI